MITKEQALLAFCDHCDNRMEHCGECDLKDIIAAIPDTPCPVCGASEGVKTIYIEKLDTTIRDALEEMRTE